MRPTFEGVGEIRPVAVVASIVGLGTFAVAQPLLDLLGRNPEFFVARRFPAPDIWLLAAGLLLVPLVVACLILALRAVDRKSTRLNSSHVRSSYAVFCSKKKTVDRQPQDRKITRLNSSHMSTSYAVFGVKNNIGKTPERGGTRNLPHVAAAGTGGKLERD